MTLKNGCKFTEREKQVLCLFAMGVSGMDIARYLGVSHKTVSMFKITAMKKIGLRKNANLIRWLRSSEARCAICDS
ncbi:helix-turn-helix domain-containing protein [Serratia nevei]|uniref:helix-turn-helix domain-containing protein n=1 Tax=Serratia TaxID=613 RepID=UPI00386D2060